MQLTPNELLWQKKLSATDAQNQDGHPTGCIKLTQGRFKVDGVPIDHTTYFRDIVFSGLPWSTVSNNPFTEASDVDVDLVIDGNHYGTHKLSVRHKPSGEAGQGNAATQLHWTSMEEIIRELNPTNMILRLLSSNEIDTHFIIDIS